MCTTLAFCRTETRLGFRLLKSMWLTFVLLFKYSLLIERHKSVLICAKFVLGKRLFRRKLYKICVTVLSASLVSYASVSSLISAQHNQRLFITLEQIRQDYELCLIAMPSPLKVLGFSYLHNMLSNVRLATTLPHPCSLLPHIFCHVL